MATRKETGERKAILAQAIRREYRSGTLAPGEMLPPVRALATRYGLSKRIVNDELQKLAEEGWLRTIPRVGIFVREDLNASRRFLDHAVVVLTAAERPHPDHRQSGWLDHVPSGALREIHQRGLHSVVLHPERLCGEVIERLAVEQPYGVVIPEMDVAVMKEYGELLRAQGVRVVMNSNDPQLELFDRVSSDQAQGAYELTIWLLDRGLRHIRLLWMGDCDTSYWSRERRIGYERALREAGIKPFEDIVAREMQGPNGLVAALKPHLTQGDVLEAILAPSDGFVSDVAGACRVLGVHPNKDVLICGYDNYWQDLASLGHDAPRPVATVDKLNEDAGAEAVRLLLDGSGETTTQNRETAPVNRVIPPRLVVVPQ